MLVLAFGLALIPAGYAQVQSVRPYIPLGAEQEARYMALLPGLRCMQCQNESLESSQAALAQDMRYKVRELIAAGDSDAQVRQYLVDRYGQYVLYKPPFQPLTWLLWLGPFGLVLLAMFVAWRVARRSRLEASSPALDEAALKRLLDETK
ncbi:MAG: cytochrome c-type biogenesis protein CcmH [Nevskiaceae bacterium]|nr:MAG: cytochrome c-type biogenesis protein CcmH [Nevskiaceae bacterium]TBR74156.1 MAG: cytochrome c-type biogenesis protein CcmH [Nevskiaceae bacterium]